MAPEPAPTYQRGDRVRLLRTISFPDVIAAQTLGTVQGHHARAADDVVSVAFDGHMLLGGVAVEAAFLALVGALVDDIPHVA
jgi:hypothetical protein